jgi:hypothetical protein
VPILCQYTTTSVEVISLKEELKINRSTTTSTSKEKDQHLICIVVSSVDRLIRRPLAGVMWKVCNESDESHFDVYFPITISVITLTPEYVFTSERRTLKPIYSNSPTHSSPDHLRLTHQRLLFLMVALICEWTRIVARILSDWKSVRRSHCFP